MEEIICDLVLKKIRESKFNPDSTVTKNKNFMQTVDYILQKYTFTDITDLEKKLINDKIILN